ncbi:MAG: hypothetical protein ACYDHW_06905 [Syntrophorhabdaceae bacterium]
MKLPREHKKTILDEFEFAIKKMKENSSPEEILFYFSSTYGVISRIFNMKFDSQLVFIHLLFNSLYNNTKARLQAIKSGDNAVKLPAEYFDSLISLTEELYTKLKNDEDIYETLEKVVLLIFITTGNGYYLYERGIFKI